MTRLQLGAVRLLETRMAVRAGGHVSEGDLRVEPDKASTAARAAHELLLHHPQGPQSGGNARDKVEPIRPTLGLASDHVPARIRTKHVQPTHRASNSRRLR